MKLKKILFFILFLIMLFIAYGYGSAANPNAPASPTKIDDPLGSTHPSPQVLIGKVIAAAMGLVGSIALAMFIYGGFVWMMAAGNAEAVTKGKNILIWATLGLVVIFTSYALVQFVFKGIGVTAE
jgi:hypothetical protein